MRQVGQSFTGPGGISFGAIRYPQCGHRNPERLCGGFFLSFFLSLMQRMYRESHEAASGWV